MRNPVISLPAMLYITDIPDWCFVEAGLPTMPLASVTAEQLGVLASQSPLQYAPKVGCYKRAGGTCPGRV